MTEKQAGELIEKLAGEYLGLKDTIAALEGEAKELREKVRGLVAADTEHEGPYVFKDAEVCEVKGRVTKTLVRKELVKLGVSGTMLDAGTKITQSEPTIRISRPKVEEKADA